MDGGSWTYYLKVTGITLNKESQYKIYIKSGDTEPDYTKDDDSSFLEDSGEGFNSLLNKAYALNKDVYGYIVEQREGKFSTPHKVKIPRVSQHKLGSRIKGYFFSNKSTIYNWEAGEYDKERNIKVKIGIITDNNILLSIKNGESNCLQKLLDYAKSNKSIYTGTVPLGESKSITSSLNITDGAYYYVYMEMDTESGKYYPIEDVSLYQALVDNTVGKNLFDYLSDSFKWNIDNGTSSTSKSPTGSTTPTSGTTNKSSNTKTADKTLASGKIPKAGVGFGLITLIIITVGGLIFAYYKCNRLKGI